MLPVVQHEATIVWPSPTTGFREVNAPLVALRPESMAVSVPCAAVRSLDTRSAGPATVFATMPPGSSDGTRSGLSVTAEGGRLTLVDRGQQLLTSVVAAGPCALPVVSDGGSTTVDLGSGPQSFGGDVRPQVVGIYTDLDPARDPLAGATARISPDTRFDTSPTGWKLAASIGALVCLAGSLWALVRLDGAVGRRPPRAAGGAGSGHDADPGPEPAPAPAPDEGSGSTRRGSGSVETRVVGGA